MATRCQGTICLLATYLGVGTESPPPSPQDDGASGDLGWDSGRRGPDQQPSSQAHHATPAVLSAFSSSFGPHTALRGETVLSL